jgi:hypothetical protein
MIVPLLPILSDHMLYFIKLYFVIHLILIHLLCCSVHISVFWLPAYFVKCVLIDCRSISAGDYQLFIESFTCVSYSWGPFRWASDPVWWKLYQEALTNALGEFENHLPDYQKIEIMMFVMSKVPYPSLDHLRGFYGPGDVLLQNILLKSLLKVLILLLMYIWD